MHVVVAGGSSGIGLEVAKCYAERGFSVSLIARNVERLEAARLGVEQVSPSNEKVFVASADVVEGEALDGALRQCEAAHGPCDVLIVAAGTVLPGFFHEQDEQHFRSQWDTNFVGVTNAVRAVYPGMRTRGHGRIMIVSSAMSFIGVPAYSAYCASKSALAGFADALRLEAMPAGVSIGICFPPDTDTPQLKEEVSLRPVEAQRLIGHVRIRSPRWVAERIVAGVDKGRGRVYFTTGIVALSVFSEIVRIWVAFWARRRLSAHRGH